MLIKYAFLRGKNAINETHKLMVSISCADLDLACPRPDGVDPQTQYNIDSGIVKGHPGSVNRRDVRVSLAIQDKHLEG